jgi:hypothetical protein
MSIKPTKITLDFQYGLGQDPYGGQLKLQSIQASVEGVTDAGTLIRLPLSKYCLEGMLQAISSDLSSDCGVVGINLGQALEDAASTLWPAPVSTVDGSSDDVPF